MKKITRIFVLLLLAGSVAFIGCKGEKGDQGDPGPQGVAGPQGPKGDTGAQGPKGDTGAVGATGAAGQNGKDGNANVKTFSKTISVADWSEVQVAGIGDGTTSAWGGAKVENAEISADKALFVFLKSGENKRALPITLVKDLDLSVEFLNFDYKTGQANLYYRKQTQLFQGQVTTAPTVDLNLEFLIMEKSVLPGLRAAGVDTNDYNAVMAYLNRQVLPERL